MIDDALQSAAFGAVTDGASPSPASSLPATMERALRDARATEESSFAQPLGVAPSIIEFDLAAGMQPGPIIAAGQRIIFNTVGVCGTGSPCGIFHIDSAGKVAIDGNNCTGTNCRHTGLAPNANGGYCSATSSQFFDGEWKEPIIYCSTSTFQAFHFLHVTNGLPAGLALGADGKIWYTDAQMNGIGRITVNDTYTVEASYFMPDALGGFSGITAGPDGAIWVTATYANQVWRATTSSVNANALPTADSQPAGITGGPDGNVWFTEFKGNKIGRITPAGTITEFPLPTADAQPLGIALGPDGALWFTEAGANKIGRITRFGDITEYPVPTPNAQPAGIVAGADGKIWFTEYQAGKIGVLTLPAPSGSPQVVEFYNGPLDTYFITANAPESAAIDNGSAGPGWSRTGSTFSSGGSTPVCRFYGSVSPGPNSHFYTADAAECESLKQLQAATPATQKRWNFESLDFSTTPPVSGACPANLVPVYRAYNNGSARGVDSNHRITSSPGAIAEVVKRGWSSEGVVLCAPL